MANTATTFDIANHHETISALQSTIERLHHERRQYLDHLLDSDEPLTDEAARKEFEFELEMIECRAPKAYTKKLKRKLGLTAPPLVRGRDYTGKIGGKKADLNAFSAWCEQKRSEDPNDLLLRLSTAMFEGAFYDPGENDDSTIEFTFRTQKKALWALLPEIELTATRILSVVALAGFPDSHRVVPGVLPR